MNSGVSSPDEPSPSQEKKYDAIYAVVARVPFGCVATYGQIATYVPRCTPRQVGYALARLDTASDVPWHRIINREGRVSLPGSAGTTQRERLRAEGIAFNRRGQIDFARHGWTDDAS
ncbi:MAG: MGMT family protein [Pseudomonadota bacterium]